MPPPATTGTSTRVEDALEQRQRAHLVAPVAAALRAARHHQVGAGPLGGTASATVPACTATRRPRRAAGRRTARSGRSSPETSAGATSGPGSRSASSCAGSRSSAQAISPTPYGALPAAATSACSSTQAGERDAPTPTMPRPPAADTAAASAPSPGPAIGAPTTGTERSKVSVSQVCSMAPLWPTGRPDNRRPERACASLRPKPRLTDEACQARPAREPGSIARSGGRCEPPAGASGRLALAGVEC